jgi:hypothetical protein
MVGSLPLTLSPVTVVPWAKFTATLIDAGVLPMFVYL